MEREPARLACISGLTATGARRRASQTDDRTRTLAGPPTEPGLSAHLPSGPLPSGRGPRFLIRTSSLSSSLSMPRAPLRRLIPLRAAAGVGLPPRHRPILQVEVGGLLLLRAK